MLVNFAVYNARKPHMSVRRFARCSCLSLAAVSFLTASALASKWDAAERELSGKIAAATGATAISLTVQNRSSLSRTDVSAISSELQTQLEAAGLRLAATGQAIANVQITLSENSQGYLWVARVQQGDNDPIVRIVSVPDSGPGMRATEPTLLAIAKIQLWTQSNQILDVGVIDSPPRLIILEPERIVLYGRLNDGQWRQDQMFLISHLRPWPRDLRGRIVLRNGSYFDAYLPGVLCTSSAGGTLYVHCNESDDPWPLSSGGLALNAFFSPTRNFFTGVLSPGLGKQTAVPAFYSAAPIARDKYVLWLFATMDGQLRAADGISDLPVSATGWGSDIASAKSTCGSGWQVLASSSSDANRPDTVRAYQFPDRDPIAVSDPVEMGGPVLALWTEQSGNTVLAVARNLRTGQYEASRLAISCGQ